MASLKYWDGAAWVPIGLGPAQPLEGWQILTPTAPWVLYAVGTDIRYRRDPFGRVSMQGLIRGGSISQVMCTLPVGYRPTYQQQRFACPARVNGVVTTAQIDVATSGTLSSSSPGPWTVSNDYIDLAGIEFDTESVTTWPPAAVAQDASTTQKGSVQLAGDLAGTAALPTVPKLASSRYQRIIRTTNAAAGNDYTTASATMAAIDATNLRITMVCSGRPVRCHLRGSCAHSVAMGMIQFAFRIDGVNPDGNILDYHSAGAGAQTPLSIAWDFLPTAASHYFEPWWAAGSATASLYTRATNPIQFVVEELPYG